MPLYLVIIASPLILLPFFLTFGFLFISLFQFEEDHNYHYLLPIAGAGILVIILAALTQIGFQILVSASIILALAVCGSIFTIIRLGAYELVVIVRKLLMPLLLFIISYMILMSPFIIQNQVGVSGYNIGNDSVVHTILADDISNNGLIISKPFITSFASNFSNDFSEILVDNSSSQVTSTMLFLDYPIGFHIVLGMVSAIVGQLSFFLFNSVAAIFVSLGVFVFFFLARYLKIRSWLIPIMSLSITLTYLTVGYYLQGFAPQVSLTPFLYSSMLGLYLFYRKSPAIFEGSFAIITILVSLIIYSYSSLLLLVPFALSAFLINSRRASLLSGVGKTLAIIATTIIGIFFTAGSSLPAFFGALRNNVFNSGSFGNLFGRVSPFTISGVWMGQDFRLPPPTSLNLLISILFAIVFLLFVILGIAKSVKSGSSFVWLVAIIPAGAIIILDGTNSPYYYSKVLQFGAPAFGIAAFYGFDTSLTFLSTHIQGKTRLASKSFLVIGIIIYSIAILRSDYLALKNNSSLTPTAKFESLRKHGDSLTGKGPILFLEKEDWGKYFLKDSDSSSLLDNAYPAKGGGMIRQGAGEENIDFDSIDYSTLDVFQYVIVANKNIISLPGPSFFPIRNDEFYTVYKRDKRMFSQLIEHLPVESFNESGLIGGVVLQPKKGLKVRLNEALSTGAIAISAYADPDVTISSDSLDSNEGWEIWAANKSYVVNTGKPDVPTRGSVSSYVSGDYDIYIQGKISTNLNIKINDLELLHKTDQKTDLMSLTKVGSIYLQKTVSTPFQISAPKTTPDKYNYLGKVIFVARKRSGSSLLRFSDSNNIYDLKISMNPGVVQFDLSDPVTDTGKIFTVHNDSNLPVKIDWIETLVKQYPKSAIEEYNDYYSKHIDFMHWQ